ncbi:MAG: metalloregulator ArsR/SmtB family transcription factor [Clostridiales bacterium]|nr:metalloregulator ArsR/SmtB family transcription factor [Clostridiales bacterium]
MDRILLLKALADETRMKMITLLLKHNDCVRALANQLEISEAAVSQHLKVLREAGFLVGERKGHFVHYEVKRTMLHELAKELEALAETRREACLQGQRGCQEKEDAMRHFSSSGSCSNKARKPCNGHGCECEGSTGHFGHHHCESGENSL